MIDQIRQQIQQRLDEVTRETARLREALAALEPSAERPAGNVRVRRANVARRSRAGAVTRSSRAASTSVAADTRRSSTSSRTAMETPDATSARRGRTSGSSVPATGRSRSGATRSAVLAALHGGQAMTAGEVANKTGLGRATVSTTLSKLAKIGEVQKAARGYRLP